MAILRYAMAEPIEMPFGLWTPISLGKHVLHGGATGRIRLNRPCAALLSNYFDHLFLICWQFIFSYSQLKMCPQISPAFLWLQTPPRNYELQSKTYFCSYNKGATLPPCSPVRHSVCLCLDMGV